MGEIADLEKALLLAAADADSRQYSDTILEEHDGQTYVEDEPVNNDSDSVLNDNKNEDLNESIPNHSSPIDTNVSGERYVNEGRKRKFDEVEPEETIRTNDGYAKVVATHYNQLEEKGLDERSRSRIFYLRNFHNWIKSMLINEYLTKIKDGKKHNSPIRVHDMCSGKGGDLSKWRKGGITLLICSDIASKSIEQCKARYDRVAEKEVQEIYIRLSTFLVIVQKCVYERSIRTPSIKLDLVSCQFAFHYSFESLPQAECMLRNAAECLQPGGYFIGTIPDAYELVARAKRSNSSTFGNDIYQVSDFDLNKPPLFGAKYNFHLEGVVDCPEFLVHFPTFVKLAKKFGLKLVRKEKFYDFYQRMKTEGRQLLSYMRSLEAYPPSGGATLAGRDPEDYVDASEFIKKEGKSNLCIGTLSKSEWEASSLYTTFVFEKVKNTWNTDGTPIYDI
ncbi:hypothetical protein NQ318_008937 [Aromia moschata]|uniref:mRNA cap guanine-N(7) methyltransferase n=1 Tax=Aromia moschata TaxID=1265417 RepID=A0AAV8ZCR3_9CUCU|nr:hypothetical protein NQ318_008937 [Aromia moschata]